MPRAVVFADACPHLEGGAQRLTRHLARELVRRGDDVRWVVPAPGGEVVRGAVDDGVDVVVVPVPPALAHYGGTTRGPRALRAVLALPRYWWQVRRALAGADVVHVNDHRGMPLFAPPARSRRVPIIYHRHWRPPPGVLERAALALASEVIVPTEAAADDPAARAGPRWEAIAGWLPPAGDPPPASRTPLVATVARLHPDKGVDTLLAAAAQLHRDRPALRVEVVGGADPNHPHHGEELAALVRDLALESVVQFHGARPDPWAVVGSCDVYVQPSRSETQGLALWQAMSLARPVVATDLPATRAVVEDGRTGRLVPSGDPDALAAAIGDLLDDPAGAAMLGAEAARAILAITDTDMVDRVIAVHARACGP